MTMSPDISRYERLITACVLKVLRRYEVEFSHEDVEELVRKVWLVLLHDGMKKLRQADPTSRLGSAGRIGLVAIDVTLDHLRTL